VKVSEPFHFTSNDVYLIVCCLLYNNIIAPCLAISIVSPACFYNAFYAAGSITATYIYCLTYVGGVEVDSTNFRCTEAAHGTTTFSPPFTYSYTCSSKLPLNYVVVYVYMVLMSGFVIPTFKIVVKYLYDHYIEKDSPWHERFASQLPLSLAELYVSPETLPARYVQSIAANHRVSRRGKKREAKLLDRIEPLFDKHRFIVRCIGFLALLVSFGIVFPPLAAIVAGAICYYSLCEQFNIGRILHEADELGYTWYLQKLGNDLEGMVDFFIPALFPMVMIGSLLFAAILFDTFGDQGGAKYAMGATIFTFILPMMIWGIGRLEWRLTTNRKTARRESNRPTDLTGGVEMRETIAIAVGNDGENPIHRRKE
jgi:hypothetical protein